VVGDQGGCLQVPKLVGQGMDLWDEDGCPWMGIGAGLVIWVLQTTSEDGSEEAESSQLSPHPWKFCKGFAGFVA
jgi:hypothetical protein